MDGMDGVIMCECVQRFNEFLVMHKSSHGIAIFILQNFETHMHRVAFNATITINGRFIKNDII